MNTPAPLVGFYPMEQGYFLRKQEAFSFRIDKAGYPGYSFLIHGITKIHWSKTHQATRGILTKTRLLSVLILFFALTSLAGCAVPEETVGTTTASATEGGAGVLEFDISKDLLAEGNYMEVCFTAADGNWTAAGFDFPLRLRRTQAQPLTERAYPGYLPSSGWDSGYEIHDCYYQELDNGFLRYELKLRANEPIRAILSDVPNAENFSLLFLSEPLDGVHTFTFDIDSAAAAQVPEIRFEGSFPENRILSSVVANVLPDICAEPVHVDILRCD